VSSASSSSGAPPRRRPLDVRTVRAAGRHEVDRVRPRPQALGHVEDLGGSGDVEGLDVVEGDHDYALHSGDDAGDRPRHQCP
jgi:hypothetical protein